MIYIINLNGIQAFQLYIIEALECWYKSNETEIIKRTAFHIFTATQ